MEDKRLQWADKITIERIEKIHPQIRQQLKNDYLEINTKLPKGIRLRFSHTLRTWKEQDELYSQGRTKAGKIVTNAKGGQSIHNYGLAFDIVILKDLDGNGTFETASWDLDKHFLRVVDFFKSKGWTWGGDFKSFKDYPHFEFSKGKTWRDFYLKENFNNNGIKYPVL